MGLRPGARASSFGEGSRLGGLRLEVRAVIVLDGLTIWSSAGALVNEGRRGDGNTFTRGLEAIAVRSVLHSFQLSTVINVSILPHHLAGNQLRLNFEGAISTLVPICVGSVIVVPGTGLMC